MTEAQFQRTVIEAAQHLGWICYHAHDSRRSQEGFPDLVLVRDRVLFVELKSERGKQSPSQRGWQHQIHLALNRWQRSTGNEVRVEPGSDAALPITMRVAAPFTYHLWRPSDWPWIEATLRGKEPKINA